MIPMPKWSHELYQEIETYVSDPDNQQTFKEDLELWIRLRATIITKAPKRKRFRKSTGPLDQNTKDKLSKALTGKPKPFNYKQVVYKGVIYPSIKHCIQVTRIPRTTLWRHLISAKHPECYYV